MYDTFSMIFILLTSIIKNNLIFTMSHIHICQEIKQHKILQDILISTTHIILKQKIAHSWKWILAICTGIFYEKQYNSDILSLIFMQLTACNFWYLIILFHTLRRCPSCKHMPGNSGSQPETDKNTLTLLHCVIT